MNISDFQQFLKKFLPRSLLVCQKSWYDFRKTQKMVQVLKTDENV